MFSVLTTLALFLPQDTPVARPTVQIVSMQPYVTRAQPITPPPWGTFLRSRHRFHDGVDLLHVSGSIDWFDADGALGLAQTLFPQPFEAAGLQVRSHNQSIHIVGGPAEVQQVAQVLNKLGASLTRAIQVELTLWNAAGLEHPGAVLSPSDYTRLVANLEPVWRSNQQTRSGSAVLFDRQRWVRYVRDLEIEVAQDSKIAVPRTDAFCDGGRVIAIPHSLVTGDDLVLHAQFGFGVPRGAPRTLHTGLPDAAELDLPTLAIVYGAFSGRIQNGGALAVLLTGHDSCGDRLLLTLRATAAAPPNQEVAAGVAMFPISALTTGALSQQMAPPTPYPSFGGDEPTPGEAQDEFESDSQIDNDTLADWLQQAVEESGANLDLHYGNGFLFASGDPTALATVTQLLREVEQRVLRTAEVNHRGMRHGDDASRPLFDFVAPTLLGRQLILARALETNVVYELNSQIAQEASSLDPCVDMAQSGTWLQLRAVPHFEGLHVSLLGQTVHTVTLPTKNVRPGGTLIPTDTASARCQHSGTVTNGQSIVHGDGPVVSSDGHGRRTSVATSVKW